MGRRSRAVSIVVLLLALAPPVAAQQPLSEFLRAAERGNLDLRAVRAALARTEGELDQVRARLLPFASARGTYTRNQYPIVFDAPEMTIVIQQTNQVTAAFQLGVPILDASAWATFLSSEAIAEAAHHRVDAAWLDAEATVVVLWYRLVAARQLIVAAEQTLATARQLLDDTAARVEAGTAPELERLRAEAALRQAERALAEARVDAVLTARDLENATFVTPSDQTVELEDDLRPEPPLETFLRGRGGHPLVCAAAADVRAAQRSLDAAWLTLVPALTGIFDQRLTNAPGFADTGLWMINLTLSWQIDFARPGLVAARGAATEQARVQQLEIEQAVETRIYAAWHRVRAERAQVAAAAAEVALQERALQDARARLAVGVATQLDVLTAQRDLFRAQVSHIAALAQLRTWRDLLRIRTGVDRPEGLQR